MLLLKLLKVERDDIPDLGTSSDGHQNKIGWKQREEKVLGNSSLNRLPGETNPDAIFDLGAGMNNQ